MQEQSITTNPRHTTIPHPFTADSTKTVNGHERVCNMCQRPIRRGQRVNQHHPIYKSQGGTATVEVHEHCHRQHHNAPGPDGLSDFQRWGMLSAMSRRWAFNLKYVKDDPAHEINREFYRSFYAH